MNAKKVVTVVVIVFLGFWMFTDPDGLAQIVKDGGGKGLGPDDRAVHGRHRLPQAALIRPSWVCSRR